MSKNGALARIGDSFPNYIHSCDVLLYPTAGQWFILGDAECPNEMDVQLSGIVL